MLIFPTCSVICNVAFSAVLLQSVYLVLSFLVNILITTCIHTMMYRVHERLVGYFSFFRLQLSMGMCPLCMNFYLRVYVIIMKSLTVERVMSTVYISVSVYKYSEVCRAMHRNSSAYSLLNMSDPLSVSSICLGSSRRTRFIFHVRLRRNVCPQLRQCGALEYRQTHSFLPGSGVPWFIHPLY